MLKAQISIGKTYVAKISGKLVHVSILSVSPYGGWNAVNLTTNREVRIKSAAKLRREFVAKKIVDSSTPADVQAGAQEKGIA